MIPDIQALEIIEERFAIPDMTKNSASSCVFDAFQKLAQYAARLIDSADYAVLVPLLQTVDELHDHCGTIVKNAIENIFIYRLTGCLDLHSERKEIIILFPVRLAAIVYRHWNAPAI